MSPCKLEGYVGAAPTPSAWKAEVLLLYEYPSAPTSKIYLVGFFFRKNGFLLNFHDYLRSQGIRTRCENGCVKPASWDTYGFLKTNRGADETSTTLTDCLKGISTRYAESSAIELLITQLLQRRLTAYRDMFTNLKLVSPELSPV